MLNFESMEQISTKQDSWNKQQEVMVKFYKQGAEQYLSSLENINNAFEEKKKCVCCMDEGTAHMNMEGKYALAGSGILYPAASREERLDKVADLLIELGVHEITSHDGCGAAKIACERDGLQTDGSDEYGKKWAEDLRRVMQEKLAGKHEVAYRHIDIKDMTRPAEYHNARTVWFDGTGRFNPAVLGKKAPQGFVIDYKNDIHKNADEDVKGYPFEELKVALTIAFGHHGFEKLFNQENPFVVVVMADDQQELDRLKELAVGFVNGLNISDETKKAVKIDGYLAKSAKELQEAA